MTTVQEDKLEDNPELGYWKSALDYSSALGHGGRVIIVGWILGEVVTLVLFVLALIHAPVPSGGEPWIWPILSLIVVVLLVLPFLAFHKQRISAIQRERQLLEKCTRNEAECRQRVQNIDVEKKEAIANAGDQLAAAMARKAELERMIEVGLSINARESWSHDRKNIKVTWIVKNLSPIKAYAVVLTIEDITILQIAPEVRSKAELIIERLVRSRLLPRGRERSEIRTLTISGYSSTEYHFVGASSVHGIAVIDERTLVVEAADELSTENFQLSFGQLPVGSYRFSLICGSDSYASMRLTYDLLLQADGTIDVSMGEVLFPGQNDSSNSRFN